MGSIFTAYISSFTLLVSCSAHRRAVYVTFSYKEYNKKKSFLIYQPMSCNTPKRVTNVNTFLPRVIENVLYVLPVLLFTSKYVVVLWTCYFMDENNKFDQMDSAC